MKLSELENIEIKVIEVPELIQVPLETPLSPADEEKYSSVL